MTSVAELSDESQDLLGQVVSESDHLSGETSLDKTVQHLCKSYLIAGGQGNTEELSEDEQAAVAEKQAEIKEDIIENL